MDYIKEDLRIYLKYDGDVSYDVKYCSLNFMMHLKCSYCKNAYKDKGNLFCCKNIIDYMGSVR